MSKQKPNEWLKWICSSQNFDELVENYDRWADIYETDVGEVWKPVPLAASSMLAKYMPNKQGTILDVGAGTGLVGIALTQLGFENIIGTDISPGMLAKAAEKDVYKSLVCCFIGDEKFRNLKMASGIIATGVFAESHAGSGELNKLQDNIEPEGVLVFTARESFLPKLKEVLDQPEWTLVDSKVMPIYEDPIYLLAYKIRKK
ncbi:class I SAM-dependent DNA methyltransferase [Hydrocoleum sp. CS-953]|uniref:class I SAM-dependent DNA methyltransferase n=1 Tax=Microcoleaceae TaxID=1892252 RepID=UPI000B9B9AE4|nr:methyltransferase domain-containing protein [Hydrocoleum sp. CS-953]